MKELGSGERTSDELGGRVLDNQCEYCVLKVNLGLILAQFDVCPLSASLGPFL
jgi:hypothetical protein